MVSARGGPGKQEDGAREGGQPAKDGIAKVTALGNGSSDSNRTPEQCAEVPSGLSGQEAGSIYPAVSSPNR